jgi:hypothetical protein
VQSVRIHGRTWKTPDRSGGSSVEEAECVLLVHAQGPGSWRVSESLLDRTHSNNYFPSCGSAALSLSVSRTRCLTISLISHARLTLGSRPPALPLLPYALFIPYPRLALSCSHRATRALVAPSRASPALVLSDVLSASHALFSFQLSRPTLVVSQLKFSQKSSNAHLILLRGRIE